MVPRLPFTEWTGFDAGDSAQQITEASRAWPGLTLLTLADITNVAWLVENRHITQLERIIFTTDLDTQSLNTEVENIKNVAGTVFNKSDVQIFEKGKLLINVPSSHNPHSMLFQTFIDFISVVSMMVVGPTGVGKSSLLNALLCPAAYTIDDEDCHFATDSGIISVTKNISKRVGPLLGDSNSPVNPLVKVFDTPGLGDSSGLDDIDTLKSIVEIINSEPVQSLLLVFKATDRFSKHIQKQLRTLEYILGPQLWDHVINVFTWWGFNSHDIKGRVKKCIKEKKDQFGGNKALTKAHCNQVDFEAEKVEEMQDGFEEYLGVTKSIPYAFPHPVFDYEDDNERNVFFANAMSIYNNAKTMRDLHCDEECQRRLEIALKSGDRTPSVLGGDRQRFDAGEKIILSCHLYLGLEASTGNKKIKWHFNDTSFGRRYIRDRNIQIQSDILFTVITESKLIIPNATFSDSGSYKCSTTENNRVLESQEVTVKVLPRKYKIGLKCII